MKIRKANRTEFEQVIRFYHELITEMQPYPHHPTWIIGTYPTDEYLTRLTENEQVFLGFEDGRIAAAMVLNGLPSDGYESVSWQVPAEETEVTIIHLLGVLPAYWGRGFGKELLDFAEQMSKVNGRKALRLDIMEGNLPARKLYERCGFCRIGTVSVFYESTGRTGFTMYEKDLRR